MKNLNASIPSNEIQAKLPFTDLTYIFGKYKQLGQDPPLTPPPDTRKPA